MWACRSFLSRPRTLLNSIRRHRVTQPPPVVALGAAAPRGLVTDTAAVTTSARCNGGGDPKTPCTNRKAPAPDDRRTAAAANRSPPAATGEKKHLFLVLDDAKYGFGIHKLDIDAAADDEVELDALPCLPTPPVVRIEHKWVDTFAVLGSNVIGMSSGIRNVSDCRSRNDGDTVTFDTRTAELALLPATSPTTCSRAASVSPSPGGLHCLKLAADDDTDGDGKKKPSRPAEDDSWCWYKINSYWYESTRWFWSGDLRSLPLSPEGITAHAVHPSERAFFVSVHCYHVDDHRGRGTFSYDTEHGFWRRHGDWVLPFVGKAHYHAGLRAWIGLHRQGSAYKGFRPDGYVCACNVLKLDGVEAPEWKLGKERLFVQGPQRRVVDAKLVDMGCGGRFCLVEIKKNGVDRKQGGVGNGEECVLRLTTFGVEYDDDGELVTTDRRPAGSFKVTKYHDFSHTYSDYWQAFWA
ncbi:unnamed protein product [Urochloa decumbens]|uniref:Uncharacterized protein n=1 Tax=Urochloa decumbens TaxID=240449 RepID=A0ABC8ZZ53_9POAL